VETEKEAKLDDSSALTDLEVNEGFFFPDILSEPLHFGMFALFQDSGLSPLFQFSYNSYETILKGGSGNLNKK